MPKNLKYLCQKYAASHQPLGHLGNDFDMSHDQGVSGRYLLYGTPVLGTVSSRIGKLPGSHQTKLGSQIDVLLSFSIHIIAFLPCSMFISSLISQFTSVQTFVQSFSDCCSCSSYLPSSSSRSRYPLGHPVFE